MKQVILFSLFILILFVSCQDEANQDTFKIGLENEFQYGELNQSDDNSLRFLISEINDSRCPSDVVCVWQGKAQIKLNIESPLNGIIILNTFDNLTDTLGDYSFKLIDVSPYPISTETIKLEEYKVTLKITSLKD